MIESLTGQGINVQQACIAVGVSQSGYYAWKGRPDAPRTLRRIWLAGEIADVHKASLGTYGAPRVTAELRCAQHPGRSRRGGGHHAPARDQRPADPAAPARREGVEDHLAGLGWTRVPAGPAERAAGHRHHRAPTREGKVYCCVVLDTFSREVVGWSIDSTQTAGLVLNALGWATQRRQHRDGLVIHSDRGVQFTSWALSHNVSAAGIAPSMGAVGSAFDNAMMKSFWGRMQVELFNRRR